MEKNEVLSNQYEIETRSGEKINLTFEVVKSLFANGADISQFEFRNFFQLCKVYKANPYIKEAYLVKYGNQPATIVLDYKVLQQRAESNPNFKGMKTGLLVMDKNGQAIERTGSYKLPDDKLIAGWCEVYRKDREFPTKVYTMFDEFKQAKKDGELNSNWAGKPCFMITKVAKAHALREAFPNMFDVNVYSSDEINVEDRNPINADFEIKNVEEVKTIVEDKAASKGLIIDGLDDEEDSLFATK